MHSSQSSNNKYIHPYPPNQHQINNHTANPPNQSFYSAQPSYASPQPKYYQQNTTYHNPQSSNSQYGRYRSPTAPASQNSYPQINRAAPMHSNPNPHMQKQHFNHLNTNQFRRNKMNKPQQQHVQPQPNSNKRNRSTTTPMQSIRKQSTYSEAQQQHQQVNMSNLNNMYKVTSADSNHSVRSRHSAHSAVSAHSQHSQHSHHSQPSAHRGSRAQTETARPRTLSTQSKRRSNKSNQPNNVTPLRLTNTTSGPPMNQYNPNNTLSPVHLGNLNSPYSPASPNETPPIRLTNARSGPQVNMHNNNRLQLTNVGSGPVMQSYKPPQNNRQEVRVFSKGYNNDIPLPNNIGITDYRDSDYVQQEDPYAQRQQPKPQLRRAETEPQSAPPGPLPSNRPYASINQTNYGYMRSVNENRETQQPTQVHAQYGFANTYNGPHQVQYSNHVQVPVHPSVQAAVYNPSAYPQGMMYNTMVYNQNQAYQTYNPNKHVAAAATQERDSESESRSGDSGSESRSSDYSGSTSRSWSESSSSHSTSYSQHSASQSASETLSESKESLPLHQDSTLPRQDTVGTMLSTSTMGTMVCKDDKTKRVSRQWSDIDPDDLKAQANVMTPLSPIMDASFGDLSSHMDTKNNDTKNDQTPSHLLLISSKIYSKNEESVRLLRAVLTTKRQKALFAGLDDKMMARMVDRMYRVECRKGECIIQQNEKGDAYFVVESGKFSIIRNDTVVGFMSAKSAFGEASLLYATPRSATIKAKHHSVAWALDASEFMKIRAKLSKKKIKKTRKKVKFLQKLVLFDGFDPGDLMDIAAAMKAILYRKGEHLITLNEANTHFFIVYKGICELEGVCEYRECDYFGEHGIMNPDVGSSGQVTAVSDEAICYVLNGTEFIKYLNPKYISTIKNHRYNPPVLDKKFANVLGAELHLSQFHLIGVIGVGRFGEISLVQHPTRFETYALKKIRKNRIADSHSERHIRCERGILSALDSAFCVKLYGTYQDKLNVYLLQEAVLGGELFDLLNFNKRFPEKTARFYAACVILAFEHLHQMNVIFRHLKPQNLLVSDNGYLKLIDFGFAKIRNDSCTLCGTPEYLPPEVIQCAHQSFSTDWWTLGVFIYQMIVGVVPFLDDPKVKMYDKILSSPVVFESKIKISQNGKDLIQSLLRKHPNKRLGSGFHGIKKIKKHPWFETDFNWNKMKQQKTTPPYLPTIANNKDISNFNQFEPQNVSENLIHDKTGNLFAWCDQF